MLGPPKGTSKHFKEQMIIKSPAPPSKGWQQEQLVGVTNSERGPAIHQRPEIIFHSRKRSEGCRSDSLFSWAKRVLFEQRLPKTEGLDLVTL